MTFEDLENSLPNGFHDAQLRRLCYDFQGGAITLEMILHAGLRKDNDPERKRSGTVRLVRPSLFCVEMPDVRYEPAANGMPVHVEGDSVRTGQNAAVDRILPALPMGTTVYRFFVEEWNSFVYLAGGHVEFSWDSEVE